MSDEKRVDREELRRAFAAREEAKNRVADAWAAARAPGAGPRESYAYRAVVRDPVVNDAFKRWRELLEPAALALLAQQPASDDEMVAAINEAIQTPGNAVQFGAACYRAAERRLGIAPAKGEGER